MILFFKILWGRYKFHMSICLLIFVYYLLGEFGFWEDEYSLWYVYGWTSLSIPLIVVIPMVLMIRDTYKQYKKINK
jgi:hypothetical protein